MDKNTTSCPAWGTGYYISCCKTLSIRLDLYEYRGLPKPLVERETPRAYETHQGRVQQPRLHPIKRRTPDTLVAMAPATWHLTTQNAWGLHDHRASAQLSVHSCRGVLCLFVHLALVLCRISPQWPTWVWASPHSPVPASKLLSHGQSQP